MESLISAGADVNSRGCDGITNLMYAADRGDEKMVETLIKAGANVNDLDDVGMNPLMRAIVGKNKTCVQLLIEAGADVNMTKNFIEIPDSALAEESETSAELVKLLIEVGADMNIPSVKGGILAFGSHVTVNSARVLLRAGAKINVFTDNNINTLKRIIAQNIPPTLSGEVYVFIAENGLPAQKEDVCMLLFAAGETMDGTNVQQIDYFGSGKMEQVPIPDFLLFKDLGFCLKHLCREAIRKHLISLDPHTHLFGRIPRLGLPGALKEYLMYDMSLDDESDTNSTKTRDFNTDANETSSSSGHFQNAAKGNITDPILIVS